jgi:hypothetical protein
LAKLLFGGTGAGPAIILIVLLAAFSWLVFSTRRRAPVVEPAVPNAFAAAGVGCALMLLSSPLAWVHYYVLLIPLSLYVIQPAPDGEAPPLSDGIIMKLLAFIPLLMLSDLVQYNLSGIPWVLSADFNCAAVLTLALALLKIRRQRGSMSTMQAPTTTGTKHPKPSRSELR